MQRYRPEYGPGLTPTADAIAGSAEAVEIVDELLDTPQRGEALAFALNKINDRSSFQRTTRKMWATRLAGSSST